MSEDRKDQRVKVQTLKAKYKSATVEEFIEQYAADISRGGIFIKTPKPPPNGTLLKIEIQLKDATPVISAVGRVVWRREQPEGGQAAGMGIKFVKVDDSSQSVIDRIVAIKGEDAGPRFDSTPPAAETLGNPAGENTSEFFGTTNPSEEMPAPQDRTMMRQMSAFLGEALRGAVEEPTKPAPSTATPGAAKPAPAPAPAPAAPSSAGVPGVASAGRPAGAKPAIPKATMVGLAPAGQSPLAAFAAEAQAKAAAADAEAAKPAAPEPAKPAAPVSAGVPGKGPVKPIGKGTMVGLAPMMPPSVTGAPEPAKPPAPKAPEPSLAAALASPADPNQTPPRGVNAASFAEDDGGSTAVADRSQIDQLLKASEEEPAAPVAPPKKPAAPPPTESEFGEPDEPEPAKPVAAPAPAPTPSAPTPPPAAPPVSAAPVPPGSAVPVPAPPAAPAAPAASKPPVALYAVIGVLLLVVIGGAAMMFLRK